MENKLHQTAGLKNVSALVLAFIQNSDTRIILKWVWNKFLIVIENIVQKPNKIMCFCKDFSFYT